MRRGFYWAPAIGLALVVVGCQRTGPLAYSPQGDRLAYYAGNQLHVRDATGDNVVSYRPVTDLAWSTDGAKVAYATETAEKKGTDGKVTPRHSSVWIYDLIKHETAQADNLTSPLCWFRGDVLAMDAMEKKNRVATVDVNSGQVRFEADAPQAIGSLVPSPATGDILATTSTVAYTFDGQDFHVGPPCPGDPIPTIGGQPVVWDPKPLTEAKMAPVLRHFNFYSWNGTSFDPFPTPTVPPHIDGDGKIVVVSLPAAVSADGSRYVAIAAAVKGNARQDAEAGHLVRQLENRPSKANSDRLNALGSKMKTVIALLSWTSSDGWRVVREEVVTNKTYRPSTIPLLDPVALKPDGHTMAWVDLDDKLQTINLP